MKTYSELIQFDDFYDRFDYLKLDGVVGNETFGFDRYLNQMFYKSYEWKTVRNHVISRDRGCDLGVSDREIWDKVIVHHMNPLTNVDILVKNKDIVDPEFLICTSLNTHNAIHFGSKDLLFELPKERKAGDTKLW